jgi:hypothetical protein
MLVKVPTLVTGLLVTVKIEGKERPTLVTVPFPVPHGIPLPLTTPPATDRQPDFPPRILSAVVCGVESSKIHEAVSASCGPMVTVKLWGHPSMHRPTAGS